MSRPASEQGGPRTGTQGRRRKRSPSDRRREARRLVERIETASLAVRERDAVEAERLGALYADKRSARREIYTERPAWEGLPVLRAAPKAGS